MPGKKIWHTFISLLLISCLFSNIAINSAFAQSDSTNLPGLSTAVQTPINGSSGTGVPDPSQLDAVTTTTETEVLPCPSGYYPNGPVPTDGTDVADQTVAGGVIYDQTVTTDRYGTTTYGGWVEENFLCTQIPPAPTCPTGETEVSPPYWNSTTNQWVGIVCTNPVTAATQKSACTTAMTARGSSYGTYFNAYATDQGAMSGANVQSHINSLQNDAQTYASTIGCWGAVAYQSQQGGISSSAAYELFSYESGTAFGACWVNSGTNTVAGTDVWTFIKNPGTCH